MPQINPVSFGYYDANDQLVDLTPAVDIQNVSLNREAIYQEWTDGNWISHRAFVRARISGTVNVGYRLESAHRAFLAGLAGAVREDGTVKLRAYVNNVEDVCVFYAFVEPVGAGKWDLLNSHQWQTTALKITER